VGYKSFDELKASVLASKQQKSCVVVRADDEHTLEAVIEARKLGLIVPTLIGNKAKIEKIYADLSEELLETVHDVSDDATALQMGIDMVKAGEAECIMKGLIQTGTFMKGVLSRKNNLRTGGQVSMLSFREIPNYHKIVAFTDTGICPHPTLEQKVEITKNAVAVLNGMGIDNPKVAVLAAAENVSDKMPETVDAAELKKMNAAGTISDCIVEGPISIDLALSKEAAEIKGFVSEVAGDADLLVFPDLVSANLTAKMIAHITGDPAGVMILGAGVPAIVCSRSATVDTKVLCITLAVCQAK
jgi:phosphate butyryltransferase